MTKAEQDLIFWSLLLIDVLQHKPTKRLGALERNYDKDEESYLAGGEL